MKKTKIVKALAVIMLTISLLSTNSIATLADENTSSTNTTVEITKIKTRESSPQIVGTKIKIGVAANGEGLQYKYVVMKDGKVTYSKGYSKNNYTYWTPSEEGNYKIYCRVKNSAGINSLISMDFLIYDNKETVITDLMNEASKHLGKTYEYGANGPDAFDCCGFTQYVYKNVLNVDIGRTTYLQISQGN